MAAYDCGMEQKFSTRKLLRCSWVGKYLFASLSSAQALSQRGRLKQSLSAGSRGRYLQYYLFMHPGLVFFSL